MKGLMSCAGLLAQIPGVRGQDSHCLRISRALACSFVSQAIPNAWTMADLETGLDGAVSSMLCFTSVVTSSILRSVVCV